MQPFLILHTCCRIFTITFLIKMVKLSTCQKKYGLRGQVVELEKR